tara:strand:+ start:6964 stop:8682 length:1719 start_codon:yes stop_codon:yes gene_type:complete
MEKIKKLKFFLKREKIDGYIIPKNDEFFCEYTPDYEDRLNYITNFSGSYGFALILKDKNYLFVDGRYTLQATNQSGKFFKIVTFPSKMPKDVLRNKKLIIGYDPKLFTQSTLNIFFKKTNCKFKMINNNLIDEIWKRKIYKSKSNFYKLPNNSVGETHNEKVKRVVSCMKKNSIDYQFISASENNAWLLNIRGKDQKYAPIPNCYTLVEKNENITFFCDLKKIPKDLKNFFSRVKFVNINLTFKYLSNIKDKNFIIDRNSCSVYFEKIISKNNKIINLVDPIYDFKSIKSKNEIKNIKVAHIYDGIALTKYLFWLKKNFNKKKLTEIDASEKLLKFRKKNAKFKSLSFPTISGSGPNGAIIHYKADKKTNRRLKKDDIYLVDSGGQYEFGTTDVTRTISFNNSTERIKNIFTRVLRGHIAVARCKLKENTFGAEIDKKARKYLNQIGLNYSHGTGHGVGYFLNVHEGPPAISKNNKTKFKEGMIVSNEPGYYEKNKFGIRIENLIYVKKRKRLKYFEDLTMVPIEKNLINKDLLNKDEKKWVNNYHKKVFKNLKNSMNDIEYLELKKACSAI